METEIANKKPNQTDITFVFPKTAFPKQNQSCQAQWFAEYKWLDYNEVNDNVTCFICKKHQRKLDQEKNKKDTFLRTGFRNWKKALTTFRDHQHQNVILLHLHSDLQSPQCLDVITIANLLAKSKDNRKRMVGKFTEKDL